MAWSKPRQWDSLLFVECTRRLIPGSTVWALMSPFPAQLETQTEGQTEDPVGATVQDATRGYDVQRWVIWGLVVVMVTVVVLAAMT